MHVDLDSDIRAIEDLIEEVKAELVIIDPISAYLGKRDSHKNADIRGILTPLAHMAMRTRVAILCIHHMNKASSNRALYRSSGSIAFSRLCQAHWSIASCSRSCTSSVRNRSKPSPTAQPASAAAAATITTRRAIPPNPAFRVRIIPIPPFKDPCATGSIPGLAADAAHPGHGSRTRVRVGGTKVG